MRRREWLVLAGVLVPFAVLVALGLHATGQREAPSPGEHLVNVPPIVEAPQRPGAVDAGPTVAAADAGLVDDAPAGLEAALAVLRPALTQCLTDARAHAPARVELRVRFRAGADGRFGDARLEGTSWQDPYVEACVEDAFEELRFAPSGREPAGVVAHTLVLEP